MNFENRGECKWRIRIRKDGINYTMNFYGSEMLIQQRQLFKEGWSNMWDITVGGSAIEGDTSQSAYFLIFEKNVVALIRIIVPCSIANSDLSGRLGLKSALY